MKIQINVTKCRDCLFIEGVLGVDGKTITQAYKCKAHGWGVHDIDRIASFCPAHGADPWIVKSPNRVPEIINLTSESFRVVNKSVDAVDTVLEIANTKGDTDVKTEDVKA